MYFSRSATSAACLALLLGGALPPVWAAAASATAGASTSRGDDAAPAALAPMLASDWRAGLDPAGFLLGQSSQACSRELLGRCDMRNSIWSARMRRLRRMKSSHRLGT